MRPLSDSTIRIGGAAALASLTLVTAALADNVFTFAEGVSYGVGGGPSGLAAADFTGNGHVDLVTTVGGADSIVVMANDGTGSFVDGPRVDLPIDGSPRDLVAGDLDGDGDPDVAIAIRDGDDGIILTMINTGAGTFTMGSITMVGERPRGMAIADMDGDGDLDIAVANRDSDTASAPMGLASCSGARPA